MGYARWYKAQSLYTKQRFAKGAQRNITDFLKASIATDSIKIFSITFCTLVTVYCTCKIAKDAFRIVLYVTNFYMQLCAVACFVLKQWFVYIAEMYNVVCYWKTVSLYCQLTTLNAASLKTSVSLVLATERLKLQVESLKWRHHRTSFIRTPL